MNLDQQIYVPSRSTVKKAGDVLRQETPAYEEYLHAVEILSTWRSLHTYPINTFQAFLRSKIKKGAYGSVIVAQRLKRVPSIIAKLKRFDDMRLDRMQDIGGLRVVLPRVSGVYSLHKSIFDSPKYRDLAAGTKDYIFEPKPDGYRCLHSTFRYENKKHPELNGLRIELQIRTSLQHAWATAVETLGVVEKSSFKTGEGDDKFKEFFKLSSALFSLDEGQPVLQEYRETKPSDIVHAAMALENTLQLTTKLEGLALSARHVEMKGTKGIHYHVMILDVEKRKISVVPFKEDEIEYAESFYTDMEKKAKDDSAKSVLLISVGGVKNIKKAYPNYFLDTNSFIKNFKRICEKFR